jgi:hypothetical protein
MLTKKTPETIAARLTIKGQGVEQSLVLTYHNREQTAFDKFVSNPELTTFPESVGTNEIRKLACFNASIVLYLVKSFDDGTDKDFPLTLDGLMELELYWPGVLMGIITGYHQARAAAVQKN